MVELRYFPVCRSYLNNGVPDLDQAPLPRTPQRTLHFQQNTPHSHQLLQYLSRRTNHLALSSQKGRAIPEATMP
jgi:hypothetical protein